MAKSLLQEQFRETALISEQLAFQSSWDFVYFVFMELAYLQVVRIQIYEVLRGRSVKFGITRAQSFHFGTIAPLEDPEEWTSIDGSSRESTS